MITIFNWETAHLYGDTFPSLLKCRFNEFVVRQAYEVPVYNGMEFDGYDTPAAVYLAYTNGEGSIKAGLRLLPTNRPYMIQELWANAVQEVALPQKADVWESTRYFLNQDLDRDARRQAHGEILCAKLEFALHCGIKSFIGIAPPKLWHHTVNKCGWISRPVGIPIEIGFSEKVQSRMIDVSEEVLGTVRANTGISYAVLPNIEQLVNREVLMSESNGYAPKQRPHDVRVA